MRQNCAVVSETIAKINCPSHQKMSSAIIHELSPYCLQDPSLAIAYFYFDFNDGRKQSVRNLISSLVTQLSRKCPSCPDCLATLYSSCIYGLNQPSTSSLTQILRDILAIFRHAYIVLDALDECSEQDDLLSFLEEIADWKLDPLHILVTSRPDRMTIERLACKFSNAIEIQSAIVDVDIRIHILERLQNDFQLSKWRMNVQDEIEASLMEGAHGM
jgi:hypothetical protein